MLDDYLQRDDVLEFIRELKTNERYFLKNKDNFFDRYLYMSNEISLYIFYEALYKYKVILDDIYLFDEYLMQLEKLYKKLDNFDDILYGINKLICTMVSIKLNIKNLNNDIYKKEIIGYIYSKYIVDGYLIHGFNTSYEDEIKVKGLTMYQDSNRLNELNKIFAKYNVISVINCDDKKISFTDNLFMSCYYSNYSPLYFYKFLYNEDYFGKKLKKEGYLLDDYELAISPLKKYMSNNLFSEADKKEVLDIVKEEWDILHRKPKKISLLLVKRKLLGANDGIAVKEYFYATEDIYDVCDRLLSPKFNSLICEEKINPEDIEILDLDGYYEKEKKKELVIDPEEELYKYQEEQVSQDFLNVYGKVSFLILIGSSLITLGVIITIITILGG